jgi:hypothetical protein
MVPSAQTKYSNPKVQVEGYLLAAAWAVVQVSGEAGTTWVR